MAGVGVGVGSVLQEVESSHHVHSSAGGNVVCVS